MSKQRLTVEEIADLPGYMTVSAIAARYGVNKGTVYHMIYSTRRLKTVFKVGKGKDDQRPLLVVAENEVKQVFADRNKQAIDDPSFLKRNGEFNKRVKAWGLAEGWTQTPIHILGAPHRVLVEAYEKANPQDLRPVPESAES